MVEYHSVQYYFNLEQTIEFCSFTTAMVKSANLTKKAALGVNPPIFVFIHAEGRTLLYIRLGINQAEPLKVTYLTVTRD
jgi:hypothetical protein